MLLTVADFRRSLPVGARVEVTNHYITRPDHPCYGTNERVVTVNSSAGVTFDVGGRTRWPRRAQLRENADGSVTILGGGISQAADEPFLTVRWKERS